MKMQNVWTIAVKAGDNGVIWGEYFAGWDKENDPDFTAMENRALEYSDINEADEDAEKLEQLGYEVDLFRSQKLKGNFS